MINIILIFYLQSMVQFCYCLYILNSKALVLFQYPFKNYRSINRYWPVLYILYLFIQNIKKENIKAENVLCILCIYEYTHIQYIF